MRLFHGLDSLPRFVEAAVTAGSFDGVHAGHRVLLERTVREARARGGESVAVTYEPHPRVTLGRAGGLRLLTSPGEKARAIGECGIDNLVVIPFTREFAALPPERFLLDCLAGRVGMKLLVTGYDHRFGRNQAGDGEFLERMSRTAGFGVVRIGAQSAGGLTVSSTALRRLIGEGDMAGAAQLLGRPYCVEGVWDGESLRSPEPLKLFPACGRYAVSLLRGGGATSATALVAADGRLLLPGAAPARGESLTVLFDGGAER